MFSCCAARTTEPEDMECKYQKVLAASLSALKLFMATVPAEQQQQGQLLHHYRDIVSQAKFWKLGKHKSNLVGLWQRNIGMKEI